MSNKSHPPTATRQESTNCAVHHLTRRVTLASLVSGIDSESMELRQTADGLVAILNGAWLAWYCGIDPAHIAVELVTMVISEVRFEEEVGAALIKKFESILATSIMQRQFFEKHVEQIGWDNEKSMCLTIDAATSLLLRQMTLPLKDGRLCHDYSQYSPTQGH